MNLPLSFSHHGASVFTTLLVKQGIPIFLDEHLERLELHAKHFNFAHPNNQQITDKLYQKISNHKLQRARITIGEDFWMCEVIPINAPDKKIYSGVKTLVSSHQVHPQLCLYKTGNYLPYFLARKEAEAHSCFEGFLTDSNGFIVDGSRTSLLFFHNNILYNINGGLDGITRRKILEYAGKLGFITSTMNLHISQIEDGQLFLSSSLLGFVPVLSCQRRLGSSNPEYEILHASLRLHDTDERLTDLIQAFMIS